MKNKIYYTIKQFCGFRTIYHLSCQFIIVDALMSLRFESSVLSQDCRHWTINIKQPSSISQSATADRIKSIKNSSPCMMQQISSELIFLWNSRFQAEIKFTRRYQIYCEYESSKNIRAGKCFWILLLAKSLSYLVSRIKHKVG